MQTLKWKFIKAILKGKVIYKVKYIEKQPLYEVIDCCGFEYVSTNCNVKACVSAGV